MKIQSLFRLRNHPETKLKPNKNPLYYTWSIIREGFKKEKNSIVKAWTFSENWGKKRSPSWFEQDEKNISRGTKFQSKSTVFHSSLPGIHLFSRVQLMNGRVGHPETDPKWGGELWKFCGFKTISLFPFLLKYKYPFFVGNYDIQQAIPGNILNHNMDADTRIIINQMGGPGWVLTRFEFVPI